MQLEKRSQFSMSWGLDFLQVDWVEGLWDLAQSESIAKLYNYVNVDYTC